METDRTRSLRFASRAEAARWFAEITVSGGLELDLPEACSGEVWRLLLEIDGEGTFGAQATVLEADEMTGASRCAIAPRADFRELLARHALEHRTGRRSPAGGSRRHERFDTCLQARFRSFQHVVSEYVSNISAGGMFLRSAEPPPLGTRLSVEVSFPTGERQRVAAEVVWRVEPDPERPQRAPGVGVRFLEGGPFDAALEQLLQGYLARRPRVLLVDDDRFFLRVLADALMGHGLEVATAENGLEASHLLKELLYELDLVVLDLRMPRLDGRALLERLRRLGFEMDLRIAVVSAADPRELSALVGPNGADDAIPKSEGVPRIVERLLSLAHAAP